MAYPHGQGGGRKNVEPVRTFCVQGGRGQFFAILCGRLLWKAPYTLLVERKKFRGFLN